MMYYRTVHRISSFTTTLCPFKLLRRWNLLKVYLADLEYCMALGTSRLFLQFKFGHKREKWNPLLCSFYVQFIGDDNKAVGVKMLYLKYNYSLRPCTKSQINSCLVLVSGKFINSQLWKWGRNQSSIHYIVFIVEYRKKEYFM